MADNDIFRIHVLRAFRPTSRDVIRYGKIEWGVLRAIQALDAVSVDWTRADIELARRIHGVTLLPWDSIEERDLRMDEVDELVGHELTDPTSSIARYAKETMPAVATDFEEFFVLAIGRLITDQIKASRIISEAAIEYDRPIEAIVHDIAAFERKLITSPEFQAKVRGIAQRTEVGHTHKIRPKGDLRTLLTIPLDDLASYAGAQI